MKQIGVERSTVTLDPDRTLAKLPARACQLTRTPHPAIDSGGIRAAEAQR
jgi:hypothetical protein